MLKNFVRLDISDIRIYNIHTMTKNKLTVEIAPGAFDQFEGTQEELDELMAEIYRMVESGEIEDQGHELTEDEFDQLPDDVKEQITNAFNNIDAPRKLQ